MGLIQIQFFPLNRFWSKIERNNKDGFSTETLLFYIYEAFKK